MRYQWNFNFRNPEFREWVKLSIPLMLGVSLVSADDWILRYFASGGAGEISRLNYAKRLFALPISILGQAAGQASMPFFARLFGEGKRKEFADSVNQSVYRVGSAALLVTALMVTAALPLVDLAFHRGHFNLQDSISTATYFAWFSLSLALWSAQALYARAFYAAGDTMTPMVASTLIVIASLPLYSAMFHRFGFAGLAMASDLGILLHTLVIAWLLNYRRAGAVRRVAVGRGSESIGDRRCRRTVVLWSRVPICKGRQLAQRFGIHGRNRGDVAPRSGDGAVGHAIDVVERVAAQEAGTDSGIPSGR